MKRGSAIALLILCVLLLVAALAPGVAWRLAVPRPLGVVILDKTVPDTTYRGHRAVVWLLNHLKLVHPGSHAPYDVAGDYVGFVPLTSRAWSVRPFPKPLGGNRVVYIADTYGVTASDLGAHASAELRTDALRRAHRLGPRRTGSSRALRRHPHRRIQHGGRTDCRFRPRPR